MKILGPFILLAMIALAVFTGEVEDKLDRGLSIPVIEK